MTEKEYGILAVSESWRNSSVTNAEVEIEGYKLIRLDRRKHRALQTGHQEWISYT